MAQCSPTSSKLHTKVSSQGSINGDSVSPKVCSQVMFLEQFFFFPSRKDVEKQVHFDQNQQNLTNVSDIRKNKDKRIDITSQEHVALRVV